MAPGVLGFLVVPAVRPVVGKCWTGGGSEAPEGAEAGAGGGGEGAAKLGAGFRTVGLAGGLGAVYADDAGAVVVKCGVLLGSVGAGLGKRVALVV